MKIRETRTEDAIEIDRIWRECGHAEHFGLPSLDRTVTSAIVVDDGHIIGFGVVKLYAEATCVLDTFESKADRLAALELLLTEAFRACEEAKIEHLHVYVQDKGMERVLIKRYDFKVASGTALVKEL